MTINERIAQYIQAGTFSYAMYSDETGYTVTLRIIGGGSVSVGPYPTEDEAFEALAQHIENNQGL